MSKNSSVFKWNLFYMQTIPLIKGKVSSNGSATMTTKNYVKTRGYILSTLKF